MDQAPDACPLCNAAETRVIRRFSSAEAARHHGLAETDRERHASLQCHIEHLWGRPDCALAECQSCGFSFASPFVAADATFYELVSDHTNYPTWKWEFQQTLDCLRRTRIAEYRTGPLLEIGAGNGALLRALGCAGWPADTLLGLEYSSSGTRAMRAANLDCRAVDARDLIADEPFVVICMFQVLEHLDALDDLFAKLDTLSQRGTDLFLSVPNRDWQRDNEALGIACDVPPNPISLWKPDHLRQLAARFGWAVRAIKAEPVTRAGAARYAFAERFLSAAATAGSTANLALQAAGKLPGTRLPRVAKGIGAALQPGCWKVAAHRLLFASPSPCIWAHLSKDR
jgi:SAM-dependent methyltransferase